MDEETEVGEAVSATERLKEVREGQELLGVLKRALLDEATDEQRRTWQYNGRRPYALASQRRDCARQLALDMIYPNQSWSEVDAEGWSRMKRGVQIERMIGRWLDRAIDYAKGDIRFDIELQQQRVEVSGRDGKPIIVGKIDGVVKFERKVDGRRWRVVFEVKSGRTFMDCRSLHDLDRGKWTRHAADQLLSCMYARGAAIGFFIIDRPGSPTIIDLYLHDHLARVESFMREAEQARACALDPDCNAEDECGTLPAHCADIRVCRMCPHFGERCHPPQLAALEGARLELDENAHEDARIACQFGEASDIVAACTKRAKDRIKANAPRDPVGGALAHIVILGDVQARVTYRSGTRVQLPKAQQIEVDAIVEQFGERVPTESCYVSFERIPGAGDAAIKTDDDDAATLFGDVQREV